MGEKSIKGLSESKVELDGSELRILIVHARWNKEIIEPLVEGAVKSLKASKVKEENIVIKPVSGSYELPFAAKRLIEQSQQTGKTGLDLLALSPPTSSKGAKERPFDAVICIGVLIKGSTMHFEYICEAVSQGLMKVGLDSNTPVIFGVLTCLTEEQAFLRAGISQNGQEGHNHGLDWGTAAVEMALLKI